MEMHQFLVGETNIFYGSLPIFNRFLYAFQRVTHRSPELLEVAQLQVEAPHPTPGQAALREIGNLYDLSWDDYYQSWILDITKSFLEFQNAMNLDFG